MKKPMDTEACPHCGRFKNRGVSIDAIIINRKKILLIKRGQAPFIGTWALPGGYTEWNESLDQTLRREVKEETNLDVLDYKLSNVYSDPKRDPRQPISVAYIVQANGKIRNGDDAQDVRWFGIDSLPTLAFDHKIIIEDAISSLKYFRDF